MFNARQVSFNDAAGAGKGNAEIPHKIRKDQFSEMKFNKKFLLFGKKILYLYKYIKK